MSLLPARSVVDGTASPPTTTAQMQTWLGTVRDFLAGLLGTDSTNPTAACGLLGATTVNQTQSGSLMTAAAAGTANALTATITGASTTALGIGQEITLIAASANTGAATLNLTLNATVIGVLAIVKGGNVALGPGDIPGGGYPINLLWSSSYNAYVMTNPSAGVITQSKVGEPFYWPSGAVLPSYGILCNGASGISSTTYSALFNVLVKSLSGATISIATPAVVTWPNHGLYVNAPVFFTTTGALPTGLTVGTTYYVISAGFTTGSFQVSATVGGAAINTSGTQSGVHTAIHAPYGCANDLSTFSVPNVPAGYTLVQSNANEGTQTVGQVIAHIHTIAVSTSGANATAGPNVLGGGSTTGSTGGAANLAAAANMRVYIRFT